MTKQERKQYLNKLGLIGYLLDNYPLSLIIYHSVWINSIINRWKNENRFNSTGTAIFG
jgi:hypothetical protein